MCTGSSHKHEIYKDSEARWGIFWTKEWEVGVWDFKGKVGYSQVDEKEPRCDNQSLAELPRTMGCWWEFDRHCLDPSSLPHLIHMC